MFTNTDKPTYTHTCVCLGKIVANSKQKHHAFDLNQFFRLLASVEQWENMPNIQTTNLQLVLILFVLFLSTMPKMCYLQRAHPPLVPIWMELKWNQNGFIRLFFFTPDTHHVHLHVHVRLLWSASRSSKSGVCWKYFELVLYAQTMAVNKHAAIFRRAEIISKG